MRYKITINGIDSVMCETRDLAIFIAKKLKEQTPYNKIVVYKNEEITFEA